MYPIAVFDLVSFLACVTALIILLRAWKRALERNVKLLLSGLLVFLLSYSSCLFLEWSGITNILEPFEDLVGALVPIWWAVTFYAFFQEMSKHDLQESEKKYRSFLDNAPIGMYTINTKGEFTYGNKKLLEMTGYRVEDWLNRPFHPIVHPEDLGCVLDRIEKRFSGQGTTEPQDIRIFHASGEIRWVKISSESIYETDGNGSRRLVGIQSFVEDVTDRKAAEEALKESEERFRETVELLPNIVCEYDHDGRFIYVNKYGLESLGYTLTDLERGLYAKELFPPEDLKKFGDRFHLLLKGEKIPSTEYRIRARDGSMIDVIATSSPRYKQGQIVGARSSVTPITERKRAEEALRKSEKRYKELSDSLPQIVFETDETGNITFSNRIAFDLFDYTQEDFNKGLNASQMLIPEDRERAAENLQKVIGGEKLGGLEYTALRKDGTTFPIVIHSTPIIHQNKPIGLRGIIMDLTEHKRSERALQQSEERYRSLVENTLDGYFICNIASGKFLFLNQRICELSGYKIEEGLERTVWDVIAPEDHRKIKERIRARLDGENMGSERNTYNAIRKDGSRFRAEVSASLVTFQGEKAIQGVLRDVTDHERLQKQLEQSQRMEAIGTLAGGIAHDFNNLLMGIQGNTSLVLLDLDPHHHHYEKLKNIEEYVQNGGELTRQLLGFSRGGKYEVKVTDLNELLKKSSQMFGRTRKEIVIKTKYQEKIWAVEVDQGQIEQVFLNLYVNAWQAMAGGGNLYLETENIVLDENYIKPFKIAPGKYVKISVTDTGIGMDKSTKERIFDPFFTTKEMGRGTGLGLASAYGIIKNHGGIINVYSEKGYGTTFNIYLPVSEKAVKEETNFLDRTLKGTETILLVDDEDMILKVGQDLLKRLGYLVFTAKSGTEAIAVYQKDQEKTDLIVLDMIMPGLNGGDTFDRLRAINPEIKVLLSSGYSIEGQATEILNRGCNGFIQKPFNLTNLSNKLREILEAK